jgi:hypothetical protein
MAGSYDKIQIQGVCINENIIKHSSAPLWPLNQTHPHPDFKNKKRLEIMNLSKEMIQYKKEIEEKYGSEILKNKNWLDFLQVDQLRNTQCPKKILAEKIIDPHSYDQVDNTLIYNSCKHTIFAAAKRQMKMAPTPDPIVADEFLEYAKAIIDKELGHYLTHFGYSYEDWYKHLNTEKQAKIDMYVQYLNGDATLTPQQVRECKNTCYEGICKIELQGKNGKPRMVCSIPLRTKFVTGPVTWKLEEVLGKHLNGYCGGMNIKQMSDKINNYIQQGFTKVVEGDGSAFDNTQDITLKRVDHYLYERVEHSIYHTSKQQFHDITHEPYKTMDVTYIQNKKRRRLFSYKILGTVFSGDCDTTLCNTMRMALYNRFVNDKYGLKYGKDYIVFSKGDDFTVLYKPYITDQMIQEIYYRYFIKSNDSVSDPNTDIFGLGQVLKMLNIGDITTFSFCSLRSWKIAEDKIILTRDPKKFFNLALFSRKIKSYTPIQRIKYYLEQSMSLRAVYSGLEVFDIMADAYDFYAYREASELIQNKKNYQKYKKYLKSVQLNGNAEDILIHLAYKHQEKQKISKKIFTGKLEYNSFEAQLYDIRRKMHYKKIGKNYWETMKNLFLKNCNYNLTPEQQKFCNQQIEKEISFEQFKSTLGLNLKSDLWQKRKLFLKKLRMLGKTSPKIGVVSKTHANY